MDKASTLKKVFMLDEVSALVNAPLWQTRQHSNEPADRIREFVRIPGAGSCAGSPSRRRKSVAGATLGLLRCPVSVSLCQVLQQSCDFYLFQRDKLILQKSCRWKLYWLLVLGTATGPCLSAALIVSFWFYKRELIESRAGWFCRGAGHRCCSASPLPFGQGLWIPKAWDGAVLRGAN